MIPERLLLPPGFSLGGRLSDCCRDVRSSSARGGRTRRRDHRPVPGATHRFRSPWLTYGNYFSIGLKIFELGDNWSAGVTVAGRATSRSSIARRALPIRSRTRQWVRADAFGSSERRSRSSLRQGSGMAIGFESVKERVHGAVLARVRGRPGSDSDPGSRGVRPDAIRTARAPVRSTGYGTRRFRNVDAIRIRGSRRQPPDSGRTTEHRWGFAYRYRRPVLSSWSSRSNASGAARRLSSRRRGPGGRAE